MYKSNREIIAENMPNDSTVLTLRKDLQTRSGIITKGTRVILRQEGKLCDGYKVILSDNYSYIYLSDVIKNGECMLSNDVPKYPQRIQKFVSEYFTIDTDRSNEYKAYLEKRHINVGLILFLLLWLAGLIAISIFGWLDEWSSDILTGLLCNALFGLLWCILGIMGATVFVYSGMQSAIRKNERAIKKLLQ